MVLPGSHSSFYLGPTMVLAWFPVMFLPGSHNGFYLVPTMVFTWFPQWFLPGSHNGFYLISKMVFTWIPQWFLELPKQFTTAMHKHVSQFWQIFLALLTSAERSPHINIHT